MIMMLDVLLGLSVLFGGNAWGNLLGMVAGHAFFFLDRLYPKMTGRRPLRMRTPSFIKAWFAEDAATQGSHQHLKKLSSSLMSNFCDEAASVQLQILEQSLRQITKMIIPV
ncbi:hypothetical protein QQ045_024978 [Rhodiola kirilowii]